MAITLTEHQPVPQVLSDGGSFKPPETPGSALASPHPPEQEAFDPSQHQLRAETDADFHEMTGGLTGLGARGDQLIAQDKVINQRTN